jgi:glycosyltransferase involved in cell wall biosynthesis
MEKLLSAGMRRAIRSLLPQFDFLHLHGVWDPVISAAASEAAQALKPYAVAPHGMLDPWSLRQKALKKKLALLCGVRRVLTRAAFLHAGNGDEERLIQPLKLETRIELIPNGIFIEEFADLPAPGSFYARHPMVNNAPYILFLGRLHYKKGLDYLVEAFALVARARADVRLVIAGADDGYKGTLERLVRARHLGDRVHVIGPLYGKEKLAAFVDATCFCLPSRQEGFSMAVTESLASGTPCVVTTTCHYPEVASAGAGEVVALDAHEIGEALLRILNQGCRRSMAEAGRRLVWTRFTWPIAARRSIDAYCAALEAQKRGT